jgi:hypothetical protein
MSHKAYPRVRGEFPPDGESESREARGEERRGERRRGKGRGE